MLAALRERGIASPYEHQAEALRAIDDGRDVVLATSTASGKSLCFQVPIIQAVLSDPKARALLVFPTKALARDQVESMRQLTGLVHDHDAGGAGVGVATYDGDTPPSERRAARARAHAIATNPDMLHRGVLPHHDAAGWSRVLAGLRYLVLDELHTYRGLFGSHVGNVLRRLWRLCRHYGARPQVIACSATIAEPGALAEALCPWSRERGGFVTVDRDASPAGPRTFFVLNPKVVDEITGVRRDSIKVTREITSILRRTGVSTLAFCRTRRAVELLTRYLREDEASERRGRGPAGTVGAEAAAHTAIRGYRGGYLPDRRREIEKALREGEARVVASTNALELGVDIGGMDAVVLAGYPGTRAASWQRVGRAGRRGQPSLAVLVLSSSPLDQFVGAEPGFLFDRPVEQARVDPDNPEVLLPHLRCAVQELPIVEGEALPGLSVDDTTLALRYLAERGGLHRERASGDGWGEGASGSRYVVLGSESPAEQVQLRGVLEESFSVLDPDGEVLAQVDFEDGPLYLHPGAIYPIEGRPYEVRALDWDGRKASVRSVSASYYTVAVSNLRVRVVDDALDQDPHEAEGDPDGLPSWGAGTGYAHVVRHVPGFKKIRFGTHETIGFGPIALPDLERHTTAAFWGLPPRTVARLSDPAQRAGAALAAAHAMRHVAALLLMCDVGDLMHAVTAGHPGAWGIALDGTAGPDALAQMEAGGVPHVILLDRNPGGAGLAVHAFTMGAAFFERVIAVVRGCGCDEGCPTCMGPSTEAAEQYGVDRPAVIAVLEGLRDAAVASTEARR